MLGATATMLYGLNIIMDPVHEELEMEPDAPGITKVQLLDFCAACLSPACVTRQLASTGSTISWKSMVSLHIIDR